MPKYYSAFGLTWSSDCELYLFDVADQAVPDVGVRQMDGAPPVRTPVDRQGKVEAFDGGFRYTLAETVVIDVEPNLVTIYPLSAWTGKLPPSFFGTVTAGLLALRGAIPLHASAIEIDGRATLICGRSGAGKSTFTSMMVQQGARFLSDDLTVLIPQCEGAMIARGRPSLRLFAPAAEGMADHGDILPREDDGKHRIIIHSEHRAAFAPLGRVIWLDIDERPMPDRIIAQMLKDLIFRRRILRRLPGNSARIAALEAAVSAVTFDRVRDIEDYDLAGAQGRATQILAMRSTRA